MARVLNLQQLLERMRVKDVSAPTEQETTVAAAFIKYWPRHGNTLNSYRRKPGCGSCKASLVGLFQDDPGRVKAMLKAIDPTEDWDVRLVDTSSPRKPERITRQGNGRTDELRDQTVVSMIGQSFDIDDTKEAYAKFLADVRMRAGRYNGLTVRSLEPGRVRVYFY